MQNYFNQKSVGIQPWTPLEVILNGFVNKLYGYTYALCNDGRVNGYYQTEFALPTSSNSVRDNVIASSMIAIIKVIVTKKTSGKRTDLWDQWENVQNFLKSSSSFGCGASDYKLSPGTSIFDKGGYLIC